MKKILIPLIFILMISITIAENLEISLIEYHPDTYNARIQIKNTAGKDLTNLKIKIDDSGEFPAANLIKDKGIVNAFVGVPAGEHIITISSKEGISESKNLYFSASKEQVIEVKEQEQEVIKKEAELRKIGEKNLEEAQRQAKDEYQRAVELGVVKEKKNYILVGVVTAVIIGIIVLYWLIKKQGK